jgi:CIC family chloride channel protein
MGAVVAATTHGPLTAIMILFEMTGDYKIILAMMISCIAASLVSGQLLKESIYTLKLTRRGLDLQAGREVNVLKSIIVRDVMNPNVETVPEGLRLAELARKITKSKFNSFPVLNGNGELTGILSFADYGEALFNEDLLDIIIAKDLATTDVQTVPENENLYNALEAISFKDFSILPVVDPNRPKYLVGVLSRRDIIGAYDKAIIKKTLLTKK